MSQPERPAKGALTRVADDAVLDASPAGTPAVTRPVGPGAVAVSGRLSVGAAGDPMEAAADRAADVALRRLAALTRGGQGSDAVAEAHQHDPSCGHVRRLPAPAAGATIGAAGGELDPGASSEINSGSGGRPLEDPVRRRMETAFGRRLDGVRVHDDSRAAKLSRSMSARAFTNGNHVYFGANEYQPGTDSGDRVLAHELAHTFQPDGPIGRDFTSTIGMVGAAMLPAFGVPMPMTPAPAEPSTEDAAAAREKAAAKQAKKQQADEEKAAKKKKETAEKEAKKRVKEAEKRAKEAAEATKKAIKQARKEAEKRAKNREKDEAARLEMEQTTGVAGRKNVGKAVSDDMTRSAGRGKGKTSQKMNDLYAEHEALLNSETAAKVTGDKVVTDDQAYQATWGKDGAASPEARLFRPDRETESEKLTRSVRAQRTEDGVTDRGEQTAQLSGAMESFYQQIAWTTEGMLAEQPHLKLTAAEAAAEAYVREQLGEDVSRELPTDPAKRSKYVAEERRKNGLPDRRPDGTTLDDASAGLAKYNKMGAPLIGPIVGGALSGTAGSGAAADRATAAAQGISVRAPEGAESAPIFGGAITAGLNADHRVASGQKADADVPGLKATDSSGDTLKAGIGNAATALFGDLMAAATSMVAWAKAEKDMEENPDTAAGLKLYSAVTSTIGNVAAIGRESALLATKIDPGLTAQVGALVPGFNIFTSMMAMASAISTTAEAGMRLTDVNKAILETRLRNVRDTTKMDALVQPLLHVGAATVKQTEQAAWALGMAITNFSTAIATVATAGGFGIPAAISASAKVLDLLHTAAHTVADSVLAHQAQGSRKEALQHLEGAAESQLRLDPAMAVDGIIMLARQGDKIAKAFLEKFRFSEEDFNRGKLVVVREKVLGRIGEVADPKRLDQTLVATVGGAAKALGELASKAGKAVKEGAGELYEALPSVEDVAMGVGAGLAGMTGVVMPALPPAPARERRDTVAAPPPAAAPASTGPVVDSSVPAHLQAAAFEGVILRKDAPAQQVKVFVGQVESMVVKDFTATAPKVEKLMLHLQKPALDDSPLSANSRRLAKKELEKMLARRRAARQ